MRTSRTARRPLRRGLLAAIGIGLVPLVSGCDPVSIVGLLSAAGGLTALDAFMLPLRSLVGTVTLLFINLI